MSVMYDPKIVPEFSSLRELTMTGSRLPPFPREAQKHIGCDGLGGHVNLLHQKSPFPVTIERKGSNPIRSAGECRSFQQKRVRKTESDGFFVWLLQRLVKDFEDGLHAGEPFGAYPSPGIAGGAIMNTRLPATIYPRVLQQGAEEHFYRERMKKGSPYEREPQSPLRLIQELSFLHERAAPFNVPDERQSSAQASGPTVRRIKSS